MKTNGKKDDVMKRLENYECEGQMDIFDVDWEAIAKKEDKEKEDEKEDEM